MSIAEKKISATYTYSAPVTLRARMHSGAVRTGQLIQVTNETSGAVYSVILKTDRPHECSCPDFQHRCKGTNNKTCKHLRGALAELAERQRGEAAAARCDRAMADRGILWG